MELAFALLAGLAIGSFLNVCISRMPLAESIVRPRSRCPHCRKPVAAYDNIPVLSYLLLGGKCRHCRRKISFRYPGIELLTAAVSALLYFKFGLGLHWFIFFAFCAAQIVLVFIDADHRILPDPITLNGIWVGILASLLLAQPSSFAASALRLAGIGATNPRLVALAASILGAVVGGGLLWLVGEIFYRVRGIEGLGFGDVKMMAMVGAFLGAPLALFTILVGSVVGSVVGLVLIRFSGKTREYELPFGTFLGFAAILAVLYGDCLLQLYMDSLRGAVL